MANRLLICSDLDRTLIPNGPQPESPGARERFAALAAHAEVTLAYVSGRHRKLVEKAIKNYSLPTPDFVVGDVGSSIYMVGPEQHWRKEVAWEEEISQDWADKNHADIKTMLRGLPELRLQEFSKQNHYKVSFYVPLQIDRDAVSEEIRKILSQAAIRASLVWSVDDPSGVGLLDILPERATKFHAVEALIKQHGFTIDHTVFCGDSGNDIEVLASPVPSVLVANAQQEVRELARQLAESNGQSDRLYMARGGFMGMNGNYTAGVLEGIAHYHSETLDWMDFDVQSRKRS